MNDIFEVIHAQRACRTFAPTPVTDDQIARVLDAAVHAPSAENRQPWEFVVVRADANRAAIGALMARLWAGGGRAHSESRLDPGLLADVDEGMTAGFAAAPVHLVVCVDTERGVQAAAAASIYPAVQNIMLTAGASGLATALTTIALGAADDLAEIVALPAHVLPMAVVPLGYPARPLGPPRREPFAAHTHRERFGTPWDQGTVGSA